MATLLTFEAHVKVAGYKWSPRSDDFVAAQRLQSPASNPPGVAPWNPLGESTPHMDLESVDDLSIDLDEQWRTVYPTTEESGLFRNFARMEPTPDEIVGFANQYGPLWFARDSFTEWEFEVRAMRFLVSLHDAIDAGKNGGPIAEHFSPDHSGRIVYPFADTLLRYPGWLVVAGLPPQFATSRKPVEAAQEYLNKAINVRLNSTGAGIQLNETNILMLRPMTLLGALWLQFALAVSASKEYRQCDTCGKFFELNPDINRTSRFYCKNACRVKAYRGRKAEANRLRDRGKTLRQIAKQLESDVPTVKKWTTQKPAKGN